MRKILITGGSGFIGSSLSKLLKFKSVGIIDTVDINTLNLCKWEAVKKLPNYDIIVHLAAMSFVPDSFKQPLSFYNNNIQSTLNILEKAKVDGSKVIFFSTYVYGPPIYLPIDEKHSTNPQNPYSQSKLICEELCKAYHRDFGVPITIFRPFNIYGPGQNGSFFIPTIIDQIKKELIQLGDSRPKRDFIYIDDVVAAVYLSIIKNDSLFKIYNLGTGISTSVKEIVNMIVNSTKSDARVAFSDQIRKGEILDTVADISKIKRELQWLPKITINRGIGLCIDDNKKRKRVGE
jgi:nucleoside-diphosphate-sugar epimerase